MTPFLGGLCFTDPTAKRGVRTFCMEYSALDRIYTGQKIQMNLQGMSASERTGVRMMTEEFLKPYYPNLVPE